MTGKIAIVGTGRVGETAALLLAQRDVCRELALLDVREGAAAGAALDISAAGPALGFDTRVHGGTEPAILAGAELVVVTAGAPRKAGMSRTDLLARNRAILDEVLDGVLEHAPHAHLLLVTNPVDAMTWYAARRTGWPRNRVFGQAGVLDSARMAAALARAAGLAPSRVSAPVIGSHGDTMVPLSRFATIHGLPARYLTTQQDLTDAGEQARHGGAEIIRLRKDSSAYHAPAAAVTAMIDAIVHDRKAIMPCVACLEGEYGERGLAIGVPAVLGASGVERVVELPLDEGELAQFCESVAEVRQALAGLSDA